MPGSTRTTSPGLISSSLRYSRLPSPPSTVAPRGIIRASPVTALRAFWRIAWSRVRPASRKNISDVTASKYAWALFVKVSWRLNPNVRRMPIEIGKSMLDLPTRTALQADAKKTRPEYATVGIASAAEMMWNA